MSRYTLHQLCRKAALTTFPLFIIYWNSQRLFWNMKLSMCVLSPVIKKSINEQNVNDVKYHVFMCFYFLNLLHVLFWKQLFWKTNSLRDNECLVTDNKTEIYYTCFTMTIIMGGHNSSSIVSLKLEYFVLSNLHSLCWKT